MILTLQKLKDLLPGEVFATGELLEQRLHNKQIRWVAKRGGYHDWAIYYNTADKSQEEVLKNGEKVTTESVIKKLVECDEQAFKMYRY